MTSNFYDYLLTNLIYDRVIEGCIVLDVITRHYEGTTSPASVAGIVRIYLEPSLSGVNSSISNQWRGTNVDLIQFGGGQYWYTRFVSGDYFFIPIIGGFHMYRARFEHDPGVYLMQSSLRMMQPTDTSSLYGTILCSGSLGLDYVFATSSTGWDWLRQVRIGAGGLQGVFNSAPIHVSINVQGNCNEQSCEGCQDIPTQRFCLAYNKCALMNCVGTAVNQKKPLCGVGQLLKGSGTMALQGIKGAWTIFSEMIGVSLELRLLSLREIRLLWPEDSFLCHVCKAKDASAQFFSLLTSIVNNALQSSNANIGYMYGGASNVDTNADAVLTISSTALNMFMHQMSLFPLYGLVASHQIMMCQTIGMLSVLDETGFVISLQPADQIQASDIIAGYLTYLLM